MKQETADKIKKMITIPLDFDEFCDKLNSLVVEDEPVCPHCGVKKIKCWKPQDYPDGEYTWECDNSQCEHDYRIKETDGVEDKPIIKFLIPVKCVACGHYSMEMAEGMSVEQVKAEIAGKLYKEWQQTVIYSLNIKEGQLFDDWLSKEANE